MTTLISPDRDMRIPDRSMSIPDRSMRIPDRSMRIPGRDTRIDVVRALALLTIFIDHVPGTAFENLTYKNFGFSDSAEARNSRLRASLSSCPGRSLSTTASRKRSMASP